MSTDNENLLADLAGEFTKKFLEPFEKEENAFEEFKKSLTATLNYLTSSTSLQLPLLIFVDELDRCRPLFAIQTLERIKHLFDIPEIKFIIATDTEQLSHSVKAIYGEGFEGRTYLRRFFSQEFSLPDPSYIDFAIHLTSELQEFKQFLFRPADHGISKTRARQDNIMVTTCDNEVKNREVAIIFASLALTFKLDLRTQLQCFERFEAIINTVNSNEELHAAYLILLIMLKAKNTETYNSYMSANKKEKRNSILQQIIGPIKESSFLSTYNDAWEPKHLAISASKLSSIYSSVSFKSRNDITDHHNGVDDIESSLAFSVQQNYDHFHQYRERVDMISWLQ